MAVCCPQLKTQTLRSPLTCFADQFRAENHAPVHACPSLSAGHTEQPNAASICLSNQHPGTQELVFLQGIHMFGIFHGFGNGFSFLEYLLPTSQLNTQIYPSLYSCPHVSQSEVISHFSGFQCIL